MRGNLDSSTIRNQTPNSFSKGLEGPRRCGHDETQVENGERKMMDRILRKSQNIL